MAEPVDARMWAKKCDERTWPASSRRFASFQAGSVLRKIPGVAETPYQPTPKPSPLVVSAPSRECRLWSISECAGANRASSRRTSAEPEYASQRHITCSFRCGARAAAEGTTSGSPPPRAACCRLVAAPVDGERVDDQHVDREEADAVERVRRDVQQLCHRVQPGEADSDPGRCAAARPDAESREHLNRSGDQDD